MSLNSQHFFIPTTAQLYGLTCDARRAQSAWLGFTLTLDLAVILTSQHQATTPDWELLQRGRASLPYDMNWFCHRRALARSVAAKKLMTQKITSDTTFRNEKGVIASACGPDTPLSGK